MPMPELPPPVKVSPVIKLFRYAFLIAGILYGGSKQKAFEILEASKAGERERRRAERAAKLEEEKVAANERDIAQIIEIFRPKPTPEELQSGKKDLIVREMSEMYTPTKIANGDLVAKSDSDIVSSALTLEVPENKDASRGNTEPETFTSTADMDENSGYFVPIKTPDTKEPPCSNDSD